MRKKDVLRNCIGCRSVYAKKELARFVLSPDRELVLDYYFKLPGRGCYVCAGEECLSNALKKNAFERAFKCKVMDLSLDQIKEAILSKASEKACSLLSIARKSGKLLVGRTSVEDGLQKGDIKLVIINKSIPEQAKISIEREAKNRNVGLEEIEQDELTDKINLGRKILGLKDAGIATSLMRELVRIREFSAGLGSL